MHVYVYVYVHVYVCTCVCVRACMRVCAYACVFARVCVHVCAHCFLVAILTQARSLAFLLAPLLASLSPGACAALPWPLFRSFPFLFLFAPLGCRLPLATFPLALLLSLPLHFKALKTRRPPLGFSRAPAPEARWVHQSRCPVPFPCSPASEARSAHQTRWPLPFVAVLRNGYRVTALPR